MEHQEKLRYIAKVKNFLRKDLPNYQALSLMDIQGISYDEIKTHNNLNNNEKKVINTINAKKIINAFNNIVMSIPDQLFKQVIELHYLEHLLLNIVAPRTNYSLSTIKIADNDACYMVGKLLEQVSI